MRQLCCLAIIQDREIVLELEGHVRVSSIRQIVAERCRWQQDRILMVGGVLDTTICSQMRLDELRSALRGSQRRFLQAYHVS